MKPFVTYIPYVVFASLTTSLVISAYVSYWKSPQYASKQKRKAEDTLLRLRSKQIETLEAQKEDLRHYLKAHDLQDEGLNAVSNDAEATLQHVRETLAEARKEAQAQVLAKQRERIASS
jgi:septal ring factor EnvC (AmiA/AmiB activator)